MEYTFYKLLEKKNQKILQQSRLYIDSPLQKRMVVMVICQINSLEQEKE